MIQIKYSPEDFNPEPHYVPEDTQIPIPEDLSWDKTNRFCEILMLNIKTCSFIVDWQLSEIEHSKVDEPFS
jgi:hypothetical protein